MLDKLRLARKLLLCLIDIFKNEGNNAVVYLGTGSDVSTLDFEHINDGSVGCRYIKYQKNVSCPLNTQRCDNVVVR